MHMLHTCISCVGKPEFDISQELMYTCTIPQHIVYVNSNNSKINFFVEFKGMLAVFQPNVVVSFYAPEMEERGAYCFCPVCHYVIPSFFYSVILSETLTLLMTFEQ